MEKEVCEICGGVTRPGAMEQHHIVPTQVTEQADMTESATASLCGNCHREVHTWYSRNVTDAAYDPEIKRFKTKLWYERAKEYESAFRNFAEYKKQQRQTGQEPR